MFNLISKVFYTEWGKDFFYFWHNFDYYYKRKVIILDVFLWRRLAQEIEDKVIISCLQQA